MQSANPGQILMGGLFDDGRHGKTPWVNGHDIIDAPG